MVGCLKADSLSCICAMVEEEGEGEGDSVELVSKSIGELSCDSTTDSPFSLSGRSFLCIVDVCFSNDDGFLTVEGAGLGVGFAEDDDDDDTAEDLDKGLETEGLIADNFKGGGAGLEDGISSNVFTLFETLTNL